MGKSKQNLPALEQLEKALDYPFQDRRLLERALTHRSWAHEQVGPGEEEKARRLHNEAFEFVGDSVLGLIVADHLFRTYPDLTEGELSRMKHRLVSTTTLAKASEHLGLGEFLRVGHGEEKTGGRYKRALLADVFEAVLASIFLDGGLERATAFVRHALGDDLAVADPKEAAAADYKTMLQEKLQAHHHGVPQYKVVETAGPPHKRVFFVEVCWAAQACVRGEGRTIKTAEMAAARLALEAIEAAGREDAPGAEDGAGDAPTPAS
ncbi:MAG TPA: ribonuclease III [Pyrinomonadaceae bacterium]|nr:ribonuclease III [Pyrinomonadaceae bacterium]